MSRIRIAFYAVLAVCSVSTAWGQYGLYGSPEVLRLPPQYAQQAPEYVQQVPQCTQRVQEDLALNPHDAMPMQQPAPAASYIPQSRYAAPARTQWSVYPDQPQYSYPAQAATTTYQPYQPYQPGAQYRYPGPVTQGPVRTAAFNTRPTSRPAAGSYVNSGYATRTAAQTALAPIGPGPQGPGMNPTLAEEDVPGGFVDPRENAGPCNGCESPDCGAGCGCGCTFDNYCGCECPWYASAMALAMSRNTGRRLWTSYETGNEPNQLTNTQDIGLAWKWGGEVRFGRRFCWGCTPVALEASYWTTSAFNGFHSTVNPLPGGTLSTPLRVGEVEFGSTSATAWFDGAGEHRLWRRDEFHNVEANLIREQLAWASDSPWDIGWALGVRWFRFEENLTFGSVQNGYGWLQDGGAHAAYLNDTITNNLVGFQFGFDAGYCLIDGCRLFVSPKFGIYNNNMHQNFQAYLGNGVIADTGGSGVPGTYPGVATRNALAFLTQIDLGVDWRFSRNWSARAGYRLLAMTGVAQADDQFVQYIVDIPEIAHIDNHASMLLHGGFVGLTYNF